MPLFLHMLTSSAGKDVHIIYFLLIEGYNENINSHKNGCHLISSLLCQVQWVDGETQAA